MNLMVLYWLRNLQNEVKQVWLLLNVSNESSDAGFFCFFFGVCSFERLPTDCHYA